MEQSHFNKAVKTPKQNNPQNTIKTENKNITQSTDEITGQIKLGETKILEGGGSSSHQSCQVDTI